MRKRILSLVMAICLVFSLLPFTASAAEITQSGSCGSDVTWTLDSDGVLTLSGSGETDSYPREAAPWYPYRDDVRSIVVEEGVTALGTNLFADMEQVVSATLPDTLQTIGEAAFLFCYSLQELHIGTGVTHISEHAFYNCSSLTEIVLPENALDLEAGLFAYCHALRSVVLPQNLQKIPNGMFSNCDSLCAVTIPDSVSSIGAYAFRECASLDAINLPQGLTSIEEGAFMDDYFSSLAIPSSVRRIGEDAFNNCGLNNVSYDGTEQDWNEIEVCSGNEILWRKLGFQLRKSGVCGENLTWTLAEGALTISGSGRMDSFGYDDQPWSSYRDSIAKVVVEDGVTSVGEYAFRACSNLCDVSLADSVNLMEYAAFEDCKALQSIVVPAGVQTIPEWGFGRCTQLKSVVLPDGLKTIGAYAFIGCGKLTDINVPSALTDVSTIAFDGCPAETVRKFFSNLPDLSGDCGDNMTYQYHDGVLTIRGTGAMWDYGEGSERSCPWEASPYAELVEKVVIEEGVTAISSFAFDHMGSVREVQLPSTLTAIPYSCFQDCGSLAEIVLPEQVQSIDYYAFDSCTSLRSITIPAAVTSIGYCAFYNCDNLRDVYYGGSRAQWESIEKDSGNDALDYAQIHYTVSAVDSGACGDGVSWTLYNNGALIISGSGEMQLSGDAPWKAHAAEIQVVRVEDGVQNIAAGAFSGCSALTDVYLPVSVTAIGADAFADCTSLRRVFFTGDWDPWNAMEKNSGNDPLEGANIYWNVEPLEINGQSEAEYYTADDDVNVYVVVYGIEPTGEWQEYDADADEWVCTDRCRNIQSYVDYQGRTRFYINCTVDTETTFRCVVKDFLGSEVISDEITVIPMAQAAEDITLGEHPLRGGAERVRAIYRFVPEEDGVYSVYSGDVSGLNCEVYDPNGRRVYDSFSDQNYELDFCRYDYELQAGETYIFSFIYYANDLSDSAAFTLAPFQDLIMFSEPEDLTVAWNGYETIPMGASAKDARCYWSVQLPDGTWRETRTWNCSDSFGFDQTSTPGDHPVRWEIRLNDEVLASGEVTVTVFKPDPLPIKEGTFVVPDQLLTLYEFVPEEDGIYSFGSVVVDGSWRLGDWGVYDENWNRIDYTDFGAYVRHGLLAGRTYYLSAENASGALCELKRLPMPTLVEGTQEVSAPQLGEADGYFCFRPAQSGYYRITIVPQYDWAGFTLYDGSFVWMDGCLSDSPEEPDFVTSYLRAGQNYYLDMNMSYEENYATVTIERCDPSADFPTVTAGSETAPIRADWNPVQYYNFVPEVTGTYRFSAPDAPDSIGWVFDSDWQEIASDDNSGPDNSFVLELALQAGETYHFGVGYDSPRDDELTWSIELAAEPLSLVSQPMDCYSAVGDTATFSVEATGQNLTYQWQYKSAGGSTWSNSGMTGAKTDTLSVKATAARNGQQYRCVVTDGTGESVTSEPATLIILSQPAFTAQPQDAEANVGDTVQFTVAATGGDLAYQWQYKSVGSETWKNSGMTGAKTDTLTVPATAARNGQQYRCVVSNTLGSAASDPAALRIKPAFAITSHPQNAEAEGSGTAEFTVAATGEGLTYQWQYLMKGSSTWKNCSSATKGYNTATLTVVGVSNGTNRNGYQYRCVVTNAAGETLTSNAAALTVKTPLAITAQPKDVTAAPGATASFTVKATGDGLKYQWQYKTATGSVWNNSSSATKGYNTATLQVTAEAKRNGYQYRCMVTDASGKSVVSNPAVLTVAATLRITAQPQSVSAASGSTASFTVAAEGNGLKYQWQYKTATGSVWNNSSSATKGYNTATLQVTAEAKRNGYQYRCVVTDAFGNTVTSDPAKLTITAGLAIKTQPKDVTAAAGTTAVFTVEASGSNLTYQWQYKTATGTAWNNSSSATVGYNTDTLKVSAAAKRNGYQYRCVITDGAGNQIITDAVKLTVQ